MARPVRGRFGGGAMLLPPWGDGDDNDDDDEKDGGIGRLNRLLEPPMDDGRDDLDTELVDEEETGDPSPSTTAPSLKGLSSLSPTTTAPTSFASNSSASFPIGPPGPPPHRRRVVHHTSFPIRASTLPSRARCCAVMSAAMTSLDKSITASRSRATGGKAVVCRGDTAAMGPSMIPFLAESRSRGMR